MLLLGGAAWYLALRLEPILKEQLQKQVHQDSNGLYQLEIKKLSIKLFLGRIYFTEPRLVPDSMRLRQLRLAHQAPLSVFNVSCQSIVLSDVDFWHLYKKKQLSIGLLMVKQPKLLLVRDLTVTPKKDGQTRKSLYQLVKPILNRISLAEIKIVDGEVNYKRVYADRITSLKLNKITVLFDDFLMDSLAEIDITRFFYSKNIHVQIDDYSYLTPSNRYKIFVKQFNLSTQDSTVIAQNASLIPQYKKMDFARKAGEQIDRFNINTDSLIIQGFHLKSFLFDERIFANKVELIRPSLEAFRDKNIPRKDLKEKLLFHEMLQTIDHEVLIKKVTINEGRIEYEEKPQGKSKSGTVFFTNLKATFTNVSNLLDPARPTIDIKSSAYLMGSGEMNFEFRFPVNPAEKTFTVNGSIRAMDLRRLNPAIDQLAFVRVKSGRLKSLNFSIKATPIASKTYMKFLYDDLEIQLLNKETGTTEKQGLATTLVNAVIIDKSNPIPQVPVRIANVIYQRDKTRSVFNFLWKSIFTALKPSVGINDKKESKIKEMEEKFKALKLRSKKKKEDKRRKDEIEKQLQKEKRSNS
ncbi:DUF748 domain-containing protein [Solitalea agri]|nr:DUF748 domain-containing protein [Solitalea agri]